MSEHTKELLGMLEEVLEFLEDQADVVDGPYGEPRPNRAMNLAQEVRDVIAKATGEKA